MDLKKGVPDFEPMAFDEVFRSHFREVYGYVAYRLFPDRDAAAEVTQDVFLAAVEAWPTYRGECSPIAWLRGIARRKTADWFRGRAARPAASAADMNEVPAPEAGSDANDERTAAISSVMRSLPQDYANLLEEKYLDGLSVRQIAQRRGVGEKSVESALSRAREAFREKYERLQIQQQER